MPTLLQYQEDRLRRLNLFKQNFLAFKQECEGNDAFGDIYHEIIKSYMEDFEETLEFHIEDIREEIIESRETHIDDDFIINIKENSDK